MTNTHTAPRERTQDWPEMTPSALEGRLYTAEARIRALETELAGAVQRERGRIGRELHDGVGQQLTALQFAARAALEEPAGDWRRRVAEISGLLEETGAELRQTVSGLSPWWIDGYTLSLALHKLAARFVRRGVTTCRAVCTGVPAELSAVECLHFYRIAQEAAANAILHGSPRRIEIALHGKDHALTLTVEDDGAGFRPDSLQDGMGLRNLRSRARDLEASFLITSIPGGGTRIVCRQNRL